MFLQQSWIALGCAAAILALPAQAQAQDYPTKAVTFISPAAAGNSVDVATRLAADRLSQLWKQQVVVLNRPGAGGLLAAQAAAGVEKDGYTLYMTQSSTWTVLPVMQEGRMPFNLQTTFAPIGFVGEQPIALAINKDLPAKNVAELLDLVRKAPDGMLFGATNRGGQAHLTGELLREKTKLNLSFVHAQGAAATLNDLLAGRLPMMFEGLGSLRPHMASGGLKLLATAAEKRLPNLPEVPTIHETVPGVVSSGWLLLMAPAGVPDAIIQKVNADLRKVLATPEVVERFHTLGTYPRDYTPVQTGEFMRAEERRWWPVVREVNRQQAAPAR
jgi:tripartite-type tricarboxylate transporter receptor subunit TctC